MAEHEAHEYRQQFLLLQNDYARQAGRQGWNKQAALLQKRAELYPHPLSQASRPAKPPKQVKEPSPPLFYIPPSY